MPKQAPIELPIGSVIAVAKDPADVVLPDGSRIRVTGGAYVLTTPGKHRIGGRAVLAIKEN